MRVLQLFAHPFAVIMKTDPRVHKCCVLYKMPLSTTNLVEINATKLRVLKNGRMVDVLTLTAGGLPDIGDDSLVISQMAGLQAQLNTKAPTSALSATAASIGADPDSVETTLGAVGATVGALGALVESVVGAVASKAEQSALDAALAQT